MKKKSIEYSELWDFIRNMKINDSHLHFQDEADLGKDVISPLNGEDEVDKALQEIAERPYQREGWRLFLNYLLNNNELSKENLLQAGEIIKSKYYVKGGYRKVFKDAGVQFGLNQHGNEPELMRKHTKHGMKCKVGMSPFSLFSSFAELDYIQNLVDMKIRSFSDFLDAAEKMIVQAKESGATVIKNAEAYYRDLRYELRTSHEAEECFNKILSQPLCPSWDPGVRFPQEQLRPLHDYMVHYFCRLAEKYDMAVGFHTGMTSSSPVPRNALELSKSHLFALYPDVRFNIMHGNMPYYQDAAFMAEKDANANVSIDMCWCYHLSPVYALEALYYWLGSVPVRSIIAYGSDAVWPEYVLRYSLLARKTVYMALARHITEDRLSEDEAQDIAQAILYDNALRIFKLDS